MGGKLEVKVMLGSSEIRLTNGERASRTWDGPSVLEAIEVLAGIGSWLPQALAGLGEEQLRARREGCGAFSLLEHVWHLRDIDAFGYLERVRRILQEDRPELPDVDGERLAAERRYNSQPLATALDELLSARKGMVAKLRSLGKEELAREAVLEGAGPLQLGDLILRWRTHDVGHRIEVEKLAVILREMR